MNVRLARHGLILALVALALGLAPGQAQTPAEVESTIRETEAQWQGADADQLVRVARCESSLRRYAVGRLGEQGVFQLLPGGSMAQLFRHWGYTDVWSVAQQAEFAARAFVAGHAASWSCR